MARPTTSKVPAWIETGSTLRSLDGLLLAGTAVVPQDAPAHAMLLMHGEGTDREQFGFYARLAEELGRAGCASLRFDLPGHGESQGRQEDITLSGLLNLIDAGLRELRTLAAGSSLSLVATGLTGGIAAGYAARRGDELDRLALIDPLIDYQRHFIDEDPRWSHGTLSHTAARELADTGTVAYPPSFRLGRAMLNEVFWLQPRGVLEAIRTPTLILHGSGPATVPFESSRTAAMALTCRHRLVEIEAPQRRQWRAPTIRAIIEWLLNGE
ncbi:alpha/beta fold hydrolase [Nocardia seriolae]|uniref:alpha/beta hydrolase n=2 Tax=Nocardia seriolae TaxID=37332 RepID=UPI00090A3352|nr:alpha/beta fold hydrolase [Nocardia seriolae]MTJ61502.1 alpha/beta fold hydrolase [Nocardia seriolae]MTJ71359.1 alpha/beta fold hydrolase [Nocardia seriolae]MTJ86531.1 alpha/beta fold hydrolase [Nocardia seriolae]MTK30526.1 alpha/beta fold hydrolase [Nocardia seriolae]MTK39472.1 alpha/beta fold hydrolase [Nocardia seriolae]